MMEREIRRPSDLGIKPMNWFVDNRTEMNAIWDGFISEGETMLFYGAAGSGKSLFAYSLSVAIAGGSESFLGQRCSSGKKVLYVDGEMSTNTVAARVDSLGQHPNVDYLSVPNLSRAFDLSGTEDREALLLNVSAGGYDFVVIDNVRTLFGMADENHAQSWTSVNDLVVRLRALGCAVIVIHHTNKGGEYSGSSNAITVFDRTCCIEKNGTDIGTGKQYWRLSVGSKSGRDGRGWGDWINELSFSVGDEGLEQRDTHGLKVEQLEQLIRSLGSLDANAQARDKVDAVNRVLGCQVGDNRTFSNLWEHSKYWWLYWEDDLRITGFADMRAWINSPCLPRVEAYDADDRSPF
ncbi:AAA family ATPase [Agarivorans sp. 1_MG-2023]|uniref:AAA family ATPase n=1 Tax=Agarivorans sp. 1_MG-2023 TaxID=3062634 RepID=UPI0026E44F7A|nr:AAA family ATPase [Agarivorans sp. 1_MG-2023]MDO6763407.1 AAA family ATPase [Agarivorans sp. 1_MG-2023]